jgi:hypothetical protein
MSCWVYNELHREWKWLVDSQTRRGSALVGLTSAEPLSVKVFWEMAEHRLSCEECRKEDNAHGIILPRIRCMSGE